MSVRPIKPFLRLTLVVHLARSLALSAVLARPYGKLCEKKLHKLHQVRKEHVQRTHGSPCSQHLCNRQLKMFGQHPSTPWPASLMLQHELCKGCQAGMQERFEESACFTAQDTCPRGCQGSSSVSACAGRSSYVWAPCPGTRSLWKLWTGRMISASSKF